MEHVGVIFRCCRGHTAARRFSLAGYVGLSRAQLRRQRWQVHGEVNGACQSGHRPKAGGGPRGGGRVTAEER